MAPLGTRSGATKRGFDDAPAGAMPPAHTTASRTMRTRASGGDSLDGTSTLSIPSSSTLQPPGPEQNSHTRRGRPPRIAGESAHWDGVPPHRQGPGATDAPTRASAASMGDDDDDGGEDGSQSFHQDAPARKRQRKSQGQGLRPCLTCRQRRRKCDEIHPKCGQCSASEVECVFSDDEPRDNMGNNVPSLAPPPPVLGGPRRDHAQESVSNHTVARLAVAMATGHDRRSLSGPSTSNIRPPPSPPSSLLASAPGETCRVEYPPASTTGPSELPMPEYDRWNTLFEAPRQKPVQQDPSADDEAAGALRARTRVPLDGHTTMLPSFTAPPAPIAPTHTPASTEQSVWQVGHDIALDDRDAVLFRNFAERSAPWLDQLDPQRRFSTCVLRLAVRNHGLMEAVLALSARHMALDRRRLGQQPDTGEATQHHHKALLFAGTTVQNHSDYAGSEQLMATLLIISMYDMLDMLDDPIGRGDWQRHLGGASRIFDAWEISDTSEEARQALWWGWLRQEVWAAFHRKRKCLLSWNPIRELPHPGLIPDDVADQAVYLLSQAVNYYAEALKAAEALQAQPTNATAAAGRPDMGARPSPGIEENGMAVPEGPACTRRRVEEGDHLLAKLEIWKDRWSESFKPLPTLPAKVGDVFSPIWIHPGRYGVALQMYHFSKILITMHKPPALSGFQNYHKIQITLRRAVEAICGIALELRDADCLIVSARCLYGAGLCVQDDRQLDKIISMMKDCEDKTGLPTAHLRASLRKEWSQV